MPAKRKRVANRKTPANARKKATAKRVKKKTRKQTKKQKRWSVERILGEARSRTRRIGLDAKPEVQQMLTDLLDEAGWTRAQLLKALVADFEARR